MGGAGPTAGGARRAISGHTGERLVTVLLASVLLTACLPGAAVVSLEFDDTLAEQLSIRSILAEHEMHATFFVNSGRLGRPGYFTVAQLRELAADGHEIGGHTVDHARLPGLPVKEQRRQICDDRQALLGLGFAVDDFAYPAGAYDGVTAALVRACGYESARTAGGLGAPSCVFCAHAEPFPLRDPFATRTHGSLRIRHDLPRLQDFVRRAQQDDGWVQFVFHHICDRCDDYSVTPEKFSALLDWLAEERDAGRLAVLTVHEVIHDARQSGADCVDWR